MAAASGSGGVGPGGTSGPVAWFVSPNPGALTLDGTRSYRVGNRDVVLIDPGPAIPGQVERLESLVGAARVAAVCLTHAHLDHSGVAAEAARAFGAEVAASPATLARRGLTGRALHDGASIEVDGGERRLTALQAPGHAADHLAYVLTPHRAVFSGDLILGSGSSVVLHPDGNVAACLRSFERLLRLEPFAIYPGHGPPVRDGAARVREYREHRLERHAQIERAVREGARSVRDVRSAVYGKLPPELVSAADASIRAHLAYMLDSGEDVPSVDGFDDVSPLPEEA